MKTINKFFEEAHLFKVFLFGFLTIGGFTYSVTQDIASNELIQNPVNVSLRLAILFGLLFGSMLTFMTSMMRKSSKFWNYSKEVQVLIDNAETKEELGSIYKGEFQSLIELAQGGPHQSELKKQYAIMQTKYEYVK